MPHRKADRGGTAGNGGTSAVGGTGGLSEVGPDVSEDTGVDVDVSEDKTPAPTLRPTDSAGGSAGSILAGVRLNAEVFTGSGTPYGEAWPRNYHVPYVRQQVVEELQAVRQVTGMNTIAYFVGTGSDFDWPTPQAEQIARLVAWRASSACGCAR